MRNHKFTKRDQAPLKRALRITVLNVCAVPISASGAVGGGAVNYGRRRRQATKEMWHRISLSMYVDCSKRRSCTPVSDHDDVDVVVTERVSQR